MKLYLGSYFAFFTPDRRHWVEVDMPKPALLTEILMELGISLGEVHLVVVNGELLESTDTLIFDGDTVKLFPAVDGG
jgi:molybdopterin converting factor small subunit